MPRPSATFERVESTQNQRRSRYQHAPLVWLSRTFGGAQSRRDEAQRLGSAAPLSIFRAAPIAKWQQAAGLPKNAFTSNGITALGLLPFHQKCGRATPRGEAHSTGGRNQVRQVNPEAYQKSAEASGEGSRL